MHAFIGVVEQDYAFVGVVEQEIKTAPVAGQVLPGVVPVDLMRETRTLRSTERLRGI
jgi:hypothetical protein